MEIARKLEPARYQILIVPSEEDEAAYENAETYEDAKDIADGREDSALGFEFATADERSAFIRGYEAGIGWLGNGLWFTSDAEEPSTPPPRRAWARSACVTGPNTFESDRLAEVMHTVGMSDGTERQVLASDPLTAIQKVNGQLASSTGEDG